VKKEVKKESSSDVGSSDDGQVQSRIKTEEEILKSYDFDENDDADEFELPPPPKKFRTFSPAMSTPTPPLTPGPAPTQAPTKKIAPSPLVKKAKQSVSPTKKPRQTSPKRLMEVKKPSKTYSRPSQRKPSSCIISSDEEFEQEEDENPRPKPLPLPSLAISYANQCDPIKDINCSNDDDFDSDDGDYVTPKLGRLVWGRMRGFPFWPGFVTRNPEGEFRRDFGCTGKRTEYHVQGRDSPIFKNYS
jgi:hypothetical protein